MINTNYIEDLSISCIQWAERVDEEIKSGLLLENDTAVVLAHAYIADKPNEYVPGTNSFSDIDIHEDTKLVGLVIFIILWILSERMEKDSSILAV